VILQTRPLPPKDVQRRYSEVARENERIRIHHREAVRQAEHLFDSLVAPTFERAA